MEFVEVDRQYADLKRQYDARTLNAEEFDARLKEMMVLDGGRWWAKSRETGEWSYHDGSQWVAAPPPHLSSRPAPGLAGAGYPSPVYSPGVPLTRPGGDTLTLAGSAPASVGQGLAAVFYVVSFLFPIAALALFLIYRTKPAPSDRQMAKIAGIVGIVGFVFWFLLLL